MTSETVPQIPSEMLPADGRFGCGPSRVRPAQIEAISTSGVMGTSHRQAPVKGVVAAIRAGLRDLYQLPDGYEVALGNGSASAFWSIAATCLVRERAAHAVCGEFSGKFAKETQGAPFLADSRVVKGEPGSIVSPSSLIDEDGAPTPDLYGYAHNETSTGACTPVERVAVDGGLTVVDGTSIAGAAAVDIANVDAYYFAPQKSFGSDGGLWLSLLSPAAVDRVEELRGVDGRWQPSILSLGTALDNSRKEQTLNTPALATLVMLADQIAWMLAEGGLAEMERRSRAASGAVYEWAESREWATPFVAEPAWRSPVVATIDLADDVDHKAVTAALRANGIVDIDPYRGLGRNQLRIGTFPATPLSDVEALLACIDWVVERI